MVNVYVLYSPKFNRIYIGLTSDLPNRFLSHNELATKGHTIKFRPWQIAYTEEFETKSEALKREYLMMPGPARYNILTNTALRRSSSDG